MVFLKKIMVFLLVFSILIVLREIIEFIKAYKKDVALNMGVKRAIILGVAISYIITIICTGFALV